MQSVAYLFYVFRSQLRQIRERGFGHAASPTSVSMFRRVSAVVFSGHNAESRLYTRVSVIFHPLELIVAFA